MASSCWSEQIINAVMNSRDGGIVTLAVIIVAKLLVNYNIIFRHGSGSKFCGEKGRLGEVLTTDF